MLTTQGTYDRLVRVRAGEEIDALVAEYSGVDLTAVAAVAEVVEAEVVAEEE